MPEESCNNHEREEDVECKGNRIVCGAYFDADGGLDATCQMRGIIDGDNAQGCTNDFSRVSLSACRTLRNAPKVARYIRLGKAMTQ